MNELWYLPFLMLTALQSVYTLYNVTMSLYYAYLIAYGDHTVCRNLQDYYMIAMLYIFAIILQFNIFDFYTTSVISTQLSGIRSVLTSIISSVASVITSLFNIPITAQYTYVIQQLTQLSLIFVPIMLLSSVNSLAKGLTRKLGRF